MIRATKAKKAALKLAAVKLPENIEGDDGSTQEQDDDVSKESAEGEIQKAEETVAGQGSRTRERNVSSVGNSAKPAGSSSGSERPLTGVGSPPVVVAAIGKSSEEGATRGLVAAAGGVEASLRGGAGALSLAQDQHQPQSRERGEQTAWIGLGGLGGNILPGDIDSGGNGVRGGAGMSEGATHAAAAAAGGEITAVARKIASVRGGSTPEAAASSSGGSTIVDKNVLGTVTAKDRG